MAPGRGAGAAVKRPRRPKLGGSAVHQEFIQTEYKDDEGRKRQGSKCRICDTPFASRNPTTLKGHLESFHFEVWEKVMGKSGQLSLLLVDLVYMFLGIDEAGRAQLVGEEPEQRESLADVLLEKPGSSTNTGSPPRVLSKAAGVKRKYNKKDLAIDPEYQELCDNLLAVWVASSTQPVTLTRHPGMQAWVKALNSKVTNAWPQIKFIVSRL